MTPDSAEISAVQPRPEDSSASDDDVDADLIGLLDDDCVPDSDPEESAPSVPSTEIASDEAIKVPAPSLSSASARAPGEQQTAAPRPGILDLLLEKGHGQLSGTVAGIVRDAEEAIARARSEALTSVSGQDNVATLPAAKAGSAEPQNLAEMMRKRRKRTDDAPVITDAQRRKKARNAFAVIGKKGVQKDARHAFDDARFSGMRLRDSVYAPSMLAGLFENFITINIADVPDKAVEIRAGQIKEYMVYGCLVKKVSKKTAKNGKRYAVWMLSNLPMHVKGKITQPLTSINCLVFDDAFDKLHTQVEGTVFALRKPQILPPRETMSALTDDPAKKKRGHSEWSGYCLKITKSSHAIPIAQATNFGICPAENQQGERCGQWFHTHISSLCHFHTKQKLKRQTSTRRPVINNAERPGAARDVFAAADPGVNVSRVEAPAVVNEKFQLQTAHKDEEQRFRESKDLDKTSKLRSLTMQIRKDSGRAKVANKQTLAEFRKQEAKRRLPRAVPGVSARAGFGSARIQAVGQTTGIGSGQSSGAAGAQLPAPVRRERTDPQERFRRARDTLLHFGFKQRSDGGFDPPTMQRCREQGIRIAANKRASVEDVTASVPKAQPADSDGEGVSRTLVEDAEMPKGDRDAISGADEKAEAKVDRPAIEESDDESDCLTLIDDAEVSHPTRDHVPDIDEQLEENISASILPAGDRVLLQ